MSLLDKIKAKANDVVGDLLTDGSDVKAKAPELVLIAEELNDIFSDGVQWDDVGAVLKRVVPPTMQLAESLKGKTGPEKKEFVVDAVYTLYKVYDPNIPRVPEFIENRIEAWLVPFLTEIIIDTLHPFLFPKDEAPADAPGQLDLPLEAEDAPE